MDAALYDEMTSTDCWNGRIVFSARGFKYALLPNPIFGYYPSDCDKKPAAIFFTPLTVSMMVQTSPDDAAIVIEDSLDVISSILEHEIPTTSAQSSPTIKILEFRCLGNRFWFGSMENDKSGGQNDQNNNATTFDALASILSTYSPGISYERFQPLNLGLQTIQEKVVGGDFSGWTPPPPPPGESPPPSHSQIMSPKSVSGKKKRGAESTKRRLAMQEEEQQQKQNHHHHHQESSPGTVSVSTRTSSSRESAAASSSPSSSTTTSSSSRSSSQKSSSSDVSSSAASWDYESMMGKSTKKTNDNQNINNGGGENSSPTRNHRHFGGASSTRLANQHYNSTNAFMLDQETQFYSARNYLLSQEAEGRMKLISDEFLPELCAKIATTKSDFQKLLFKQLEAVHQVNVTTLNSRQSFLNSSLEGIPQSYALEEPTSEVVGKFINELEKSVRVRMSMYLLNGTGPQVIQQRQQAEAQTMYRSLSDQLERLKSQNSHLAVQLAQERRHIDDIESELERTKGELMKAKSREQAVLSRMRKREADWAASGGGGGVGGAGGSLVVHDVMSSDQHHHM